MNQIESHSQTLEFDANKNQTTELNRIPSTGILYQHPTQAEMRRSRLAQFKADAKDFALFIVFAICAWLLITLLLTAFFGG